MAWLEALGPAVLLAWLSLAALAWAVRPRARHTPASAYRRSFLALLLACSCFGLPWLREVLPAVPTGFSPLQLSVRVLASTAERGPAEVRGLVLSPFAVLSGVWLFTSGVATLRLLSAQLRLQRLLMRATPAGALELELLREELACTETKAPRLLVSELATAPFSVGFWRPAIVLPIAVVETLELAELRLVLRHELLHLQRRDPLTHALARLCALPFAGHPCLPALLRQLSLTREVAVDARAAAEDPRSYARLLLRLAELSRFGTESAQVAMDDTALSRRIAALTHPVAGLMPAPLGAPFAALALIALAALLAPRVVPELRPAGLPFAHALGAPGVPFVARDDLPFQLAVPVPNPLAAYEGEISACYERARREDGRLTVDTLARFSLDPSTFGVIDVDLAVPASPTFERCLAQRAKTWRFPPPPDAPPLPAMLAADAEAVVAVHIQRHP